MVNISPEKPDRLFIVGSGSPPSLVKCLASRGSQAFLRSLHGRIRALGHDYVEGYFRGVQVAGLVLPPLEAAFAGFRCMCFPAEVLTMDVRQFQAEMSTGNNSDASNLFGTICATLATAAGNLTLSRQAHKCWLAR
jgi:hypothetical protein